MLMRFDPFRELDRLADQAWRAGRMPVMPIDAYRHGDVFIVDFNLPGVEPSSIDLTIERNVLTVSAERTWQRQDGVDVVAAERPQGKFSRQLFLGDGLDSSKVEANYTNGVLTVRLPVADQAKPRKVEISAGADKGAAIARDLDACIAIGLAGGSHRRPITEPPAQPPLPNEQLQAHVGLHSAGALQRRKV